MPVTAAYANKKVQELRELREVLGREVVVVSQTLLQVPPQRASLDGADHRLSF